MRSLHNQHVINSEAESERRAAARDPKNKRNRQMIAAISRERFSATQYRFALAWSLVLPGNQVPSPRPSFSPEDGRIFFSLHIFTKSLRICAYPLRAWQPVEDLSGRPRSSYRLQRG